MRRRTRRRAKGRWTKRIAIGLLAIPMLYLLAAVAGALIPVNASWAEPDEGITIYLADNGVHADLILPANTQGLDWSPLLPQSDFAQLPIPWPPPRIVMRSQVLPASCIRF